jgi:hypothetical protein
MEITRELFEQQRRPRFGNSNPEQMHVAFWEWMIRGDEILSTDRKGGLAKMGLLMRDGKLKSSFGPYRARDFFGVPPNREDGPIWTFDRMGTTRNGLPDGRVICIGGEHEDSYDPDFCIYNDVVVFDTDEEIRIYGYPRESFPPTDFHTATCIGDRVVIIGGLGYKNERVVGHTPVYALDLSDFHIEEVETTGEMPGWISKHEAEIEDSGGIRIRGGQIVRDYRGRQLFLRNIEDYSLDLKSRAWQRTTDRRWFQTKIWRDDNHAFPLKPYSKAESLLPRNIPHTVVQCDWTNARMLIEGVEVSIDVGVSDIEIIVEGSLRQDLLTRLSEELLINAQVLTQSRCTFLRL